MPSVHKCLMLLLFGALRARALPLLDAIAVGSEVEEAAETPTPTPFAGSSVQTPGAEYEPAGAAPTTAIASSYYVAPTTSYAYTSAAPTYTSVAPTSSSVYTSPVSSSTPTSGGGGGSCGPIGSGARVTNSNAFSNGAAISGAPSTNGVAVNNGYTCYSGIASSFPDSSSWISWSAMWSNNLDVIKNSCSNNGWGADNTDEQVSWIQQAILNVAQSSYVDPRFILAIVLQESEGCINVPTTNNGVVNPGLMQSHDGASWSQCSSQGLACVQQMIADGTQGVAGSSGGPGLVQGINALGDVYDAARLYNSGSVDTSQLNNGISSTASYVVDIANRLTGWNGLSVTRNTCPNESNSGWGSGKTYC